MSTTMPRRPGSARVLPMVSHPDFERDQVNNLVRKMQEHVGDLIPEGEAIKPFFANPDTTLRILNEAISEMMVRGWEVEVKFGRPRSSVHFS